MCSSRLEMCNKTWSLFNLKIEIDVILLPPFFFFLHSLQFTNSLPRELTRILKLVSSPFI